MENISLSEANSSFRWLVIVNVLHTFGAGTFILVLQEFLFISIAEYDMAKTAALWGAFGVTQRVTRITASPMVGAFVDARGRKSWYYLCLTTVLLWIVLTYFVPSLFTFFAACSLEGIFGNIDVVTMTTIGDAGRVMADQRKSGGKVQPEGETGGPSLRQLMAEITTKLYGYMSAWYVMAYGVSTVIAGILIDVGTTNAENELKLNSTKLETNKTCGQEEEKIELPNNDHLTFPVQLSIGYIIVCFIVVIFFLPETDKWDSGIAEKESEKESDKKDGKEKEPGLVDTVKEIFKSTWLVCMSAGLLVIEACQQGTLSSLYLYAKYEHDVSATTFSLVLLWTMFCSALCNTLGIKYFVKYMGLWPALYMSCIAGGLGLITVGFSPIFGFPLVVVGLSCNLFNVAKPILRGKFCAGFPNSEQGKAQGCLHVILKIGDIIGGAFGVFLLSVAITIETGMDDVDANDCLQTGKRTLLGGIGFICLGTMSLLALFLAKFAKSVEPVGDKERRSTSGGV